MNRRDRRWLRVHERARQDQHMAEAREHGVREPRTAVMMTTYVEDDPAPRCCWCDCPDDVHTEPGVVCDGCPADAAYVVQVLVGSPNEQSVPVCEPHQPDVVRFFNTMLKPALGTDVFHRPVRDDDFA